MFGGILMVLMFLIAVFLILLVLVQRGRGGGLAGALGGMGGQSAFGTKAGDLFTRITIGAATVWILLCVLGVKYFNADETFDTSLGGAAKQTDLIPRPGPGGLPASIPAAPGGAGAAQGGGSPAETPPPDSSVTPAASQESPPPNAGTPAEPPSESAEAPQ